MVKLYKKPRGVRLLILIKWIVHFLRSQNCTHTNWYKVPLNTLTESLLLVITFFSISRPAEILYTDETENSEWEIITTGLRWEI